MSLDRFIEIAIWPLALVFCVLVICLLFWKPIADLIGRARRATYGDKSIDFTREDPKVAAEQQKKVEESPIKATATVPTSAVLPPPTALYAPIEQQISTTLSAATLPNEIEKAWLIRALAMAHVAHSHEIVYRLILGSQREVVPVV